MKYALNGKPGWYEIDRSIPFQLGLKYLIYHIAKSSLPPPTFFF